MRVVLDGQLLESNAQSLSVAIARAATAAEAHGRFIVEVVADGTILDQQLLGNPENAPPGIRELCLSSADPRELVRTTLESAAIALDDARDHQSEAADLILRGKLDEARSPLRSALETWQSVRTAVDHSAALLKMDAGSPGGPLEMLLAHLHASLAQVKESLERQDFAALADELSFKLDSLASEWQASLRDIAHSLGENAPSRAGGAS